MCDVAFSSSSLFSLQSSDDSPTPLLSLHELPHPHVILEANGGGTQTSVRVNSATPRSKQTLNLKVKSSLLFSFMLMTSCRLVMIHMKSSCSKVISPNTILNQFYEVELSLSYFLTCLFHQFHYRLVKFTFTIRNSL